MVYRRNEMGHIRSENVEFISITAFRDIGSGEQTYSAVFQALNGTNAYQFIEGCPHRNIAAKPLYQFAEGHIRTSQSPADCKDQCRHAFYRGPTPERLQLRALTLGLEALLEALPG